jgi:hypothetical protein
MTEQEPYNFISGCMKYDMLLQIISARATTDSSLFDPERISEETS